MQKHTKIYLKFFDYGIDDFIPCEICSAKSVDIHHIKGRIGRLMTDIYNLIALCRECHIKAHNNEFNKSELMNIHLKKIKLHNKI